MSVDLKLSPDGRTAILTANVDISDLVAEAEDAANRKNPNNVTNDVWQRCIEQINESAQVEQLNATDAEIDADDDRSPNEKARLKAARPTGNLRSELQQRVPKREAVETPTR